MRSVASLIVFVGSIFVGGLLHAQDAKTVDPAQMEAMWKAFATPGEPHAALAKMQGEWLVEATDYMSNPAAPTTSKGESVFETVLDGRFLVQHYHGNFGGQAFEGMGVTGYDNAKKKFVGSWIDNMGTGIMNTEGTYDADKMTMTEYSEMSSPMGPMKVKMVTTHETNDRFTFTMYSTMPDGKEAKTMEMVYTRK